MFSGTSKRLIRYVGGVTLEDFKDVALRSTVKTFCEDAEKTNSSVTQAEIKGTRLHQSHDDSGDTKPVISVRFLSEGGRRLGTGHVHEDGTGNVNWK